MKHILEADSIILEFGTRVILSDIFLRCETGMCVGILGRNGEGKSCLLNIIYGTLATNSKSIRIDEVSHFKLFKNPSILTYLPQFNFTPKHLTVKRIFSDFNLSFNAFLQYFPLYESYYNIPIKNLSGGQRRLIEVYIIIMSKSKFSILDEPFSHLMPVQIEKIIELINKVKVRKGFIITDHMYKYVLDMTDDLYILSESKLHLVKDITDLERLGYIRI